MKKKKDSIWDKRFNKYDWMVFIICLLIIVIGLIFNFDFDKPCREFDVIGKIFLIIGVFIMFYFAVRLWHSCTKEFSKLLGLEGKDKKK